MGATRRQVLRGLGAAALAATAGAGLAACGAGSGTPGGGGGSLRFAWWGNDVRNKATNAAIAAYQAANVGVTINAEPGEWGTYWEKLGTQMAANDAPDIIQMDEKYIREYGDRGALLDLAKSGVDTAKFATGTAEPGIVDGKLIGVNAGSNTPILIANPKIFTDLKVDLPDDTTWTWEGYRDLAAQLTAKGGGKVGTAMVFNNDAILSAWLRQHGKNLFNKEGLAFEQADIEQYLTFMLTFQDAKAQPAAAVVSEDMSKALAQTLFATGGAAMGMCWSNQVKAFDQATGQDLKLLRLPSMAGKATERKAWYKASMFFSANGRSDNAEASGKFINWLVNSTEAGNILLTERGLTPNTEVLAAIESKLSPSDKKVATFMADIKPELSEAPPPPVVGGGTIQDVLGRGCTDVLFGKSTPADAAKKLIDELNGQIKK